MQYLVAGLSHDMGAPLRAVVQFAQLLVEQPNNNFDEEELKCLKLIQQNGEKAQAMLGALRRFSRLNRDNEEETSLSLRLLLDDVLAQKAATIEATAARIEIVCDVPAILGDSNYWNLFFECLIDNALLFQKKTGDQAPIINIEAKRFNGFLQICVEDNGIGVSDSNWALISAPFKRLNHAKDYPGFGMGLAFCERIANIHGGTLRFSHSELGGLAVTFQESAH